MRPNTIAARQPAPVHNRRRQRSQPPTTLWDILCIICCGPCYLLVKCYGILDRSIARNRRRKHQYAAWPKPITSSSGTQIQPLTISEKNSAPQSKFFHLPLELRLLIYNYVFGLTDIHLVTFRYPGYSFHDRPYEYHLDSYPCFDPSAAARNHMCVCLTGWRQRTNGGRMIVTRFPDPGLGNDVTSLMLTCREFYHDILNITLNHRTFQVDNLDTLILASMVISHQLRSIRSLYLNTKVIAANTSFTGTTSHFPSSYRDRFSHLPPRTPSIPKEKGKSYQGIWDAACDVISNMTSLKRLKIQLSFEAFEDVLHARDPEVIGSRESFVFEPLRRIAKKRDLDVFEVEVDWPEGTGKKTQKGRQKESFVLKRREAWTIPGVIVGR